ncbi:MAG: helix-turn-helix transcriptional regulator [Butyrivibrio sp.]|nr:helix-turn-helix transcriptional regulator [Butyrivibrio sp.]
MGIKNRLTSLLDERSMNTNELAQRINVTPSTLYSLLQRDSNRIDIDLIMKISHALGITADELLTDEISQLTEPAASSAPVDVQKAQLLKYYELLNEEGRNRLIEQAQFFASQDKYKETKIDESAG